MRVLSVDPGSFADDIGLQENDTIIGVNRQAVSTPEDILRLQKSLKPGAPVAAATVRSLRRSREILLTIMPSNS